MDSSVNEQVLADLPVRPEQKVSAVISEHPELVDVFVRLSPAFKRLKNPLMRKTFARLATVRQAAAVAGVPAGELVRVLNEALGAELDQEQMEVLKAMDGPRDEGGPDQPPKWTESVEPREELDVRPYQERGEDPFSVIMEVTDRISEGEAFRLRNTFEPFPLYEVLERKGFTHWAEQQGERDWLITFFREGAGGTAEPGGAGPSEAPDAGEAYAAGDPVLAADSPPPDDAVDAVVTIEVEDLVPPLPMQKVLEGLALVPPGGVLLVHHRRSPAHLFSKLEEFGHSYRLWELGPDRKEIAVRKAAE